MKYIVAYSCKKNDYDIAIGAIETEIERVPYSNVVTVSIYKELTTQVENILHKDFPKCHGIIILSITPIRCDNDN